MPPRVTLYSSSSGTHPRQGLHNALKGKERSEVAMDVEEAEIMSDELDELADDTFDTFDDPNTTQPQWETISSSAAAKTVVKRPRQKPPAIRTPGQPLVSMNRVETIVNADPETGPMSKEALFVIALATEDFVRRLTRVAHSRSKHDGRALTTYSDFADTAHFFSEFNFLKDIMPRAMTVNEALAERELVIKRREALLNGLDFDAAKASKPSDKTTGEKSSSVSVNGKMSIEVEDVIMSTSGVAENQKSKRLKISRPTERRSSPHTPSSTPESEHKRPQIRIPRRDGPRPPTSKADEVRKERSFKEEDGRKGNIWLSKEPYSGFDLRRFGPRIVRTTEENLEDLHLEESDKSPPPNDASDVQRKGSGGLALAPVLVGVDRAPLWTNVPLPPPPSPNTHKHSANGSVHEKELGKQQHPSPQRIGPDSDAEKEFLRAANAFKRHNELGDVGRQRPTQQRTIYTRDTEPQR